MRAAEALLVAILAYTAARYLGPVAVADVLGLWGLAWAFSLALGEVRRRVLHAPAPNDLRAPGDV